MLAISLLSLLSTAVAQGLNNPFIGCYSATGTGGVPAPATFFGLTFEQCLTQCSGSTPPFQYASFREPIIPSECTCTMTMPVSTTFINEDPVGNLCTATNWATYTLLSSFSPPVAGTACYTTDPVIPLTDSVTSFLQCQQLCSTTNYLAYLVSGDPLEASCGCLAAEDLNALPDEGTCTTDPILLFHDADAAASSLTRRRVQAVRAARLARSKSLCPAGLSACRIPGNSMVDHECVDTTSELESCGGCLYGDLDNASAAPGVDCSYGAAIGGATCNRGQCHVTKCRPGFVLVDGVCV